MGPAPDPLNRYQTLQAISLILSLVGGAVALAGLGAVAVIAGSGEFEFDTSLVSILIVTAAGVLALVVGLVSNTVRALVVREALPPSRYRGPSIIAMIVIVEIVANTASAAVIGEVAALAGGAEPTFGGSLLLLTAVQLGLLAVAALFVAVPRALSGVRLLPTAGLARSMAIGLAVAVPAWIVAQALSLVIARLLELVDYHEPDTGVLQAALDRVDPIVLVIALVLVAPVAEEIFFRGIAYNAWLREYGPRRALFGSAILFAAIHASLVALLPFFLLGLALALAYRRTGSLPAAIALHAGFNGISVALALLARFDIIRLPT